MDFSTYVIFHNKYLYLDSTILFCKKSKIFMETLFLFHKKSHWTIGIFSGNIPHQIPKNQKDHAGSQNPIHMPYLVP